MEFLDTLGTVLPDVERNAGVEGTPNIFVREGWFGAGHIMGTHRMGSDPATSVVNADAASPRPREPLHARLRQLAQLRHREPITDHRSTGAAGGGDDREGVDAVRKMAGGRLPKPANDWLISGRCRR